jgi:HD-like signal output (HDOD) protein
MIKFLRTIFHGVKPNKKISIELEKPTASVASNSVNDTLRASNSHLLWNHLPIDLSLCFNEWVIGISESAELESNTAENQLLKSIDNLLAGDAEISELLPRVPLVMPRLLASMGDENIDASEIAQDIARDPSIVGEVIRIANSAYYNSSVTTSTLEQALLKLGLNGLRQVISVIAFRSIINLHTGKVLAQGSPKLWQQTERSAYVSGVLAKLENVDAFDAHLAILVQNVGMIVILKLIDQQGDCEQKSLSVNFYPAIERLARRLTLSIVKSWGFPSNVINVLEELIHINDRSKISALATVIYASNRFGKLFSLEENGLISFDPNDYFVGLDLRFKNNCEECYKTLKVLGITLE